MTKIALLLALLLAAPPARAEHISSFAGRWAAEGYDCVDAHGNLTPFDEDVMLEIRGRSLVAVKIDGDPCVGPGETSWILRTESSSVAYGKSYSVASKLGHPTGTRSWETGALTFNGPDEIIWFVHRPYKDLMVVFRRKKGPALSF